MRCLLTFVSLFQRDVAVINAIQQILHLSKIQNLKAIAEIVISASKNFFEKTSFIMFV